VTYRIVDMAEAQAVGLCLLSRGGLPDIFSLRSAAAQMHAERCDWCDYPADELNQMLVNIDVSEYHEKQWWEMPNRSRRRAIELAQGRP
jgi:hypothetical protein